MNWPFKLALVFLLGTSVLNATTRISFEAEELRDLYVDASENNNYFRVHADEPSGDGSSSSAPIKVYIPISSGLDQDENFVLGANAPIPKTTAGTFRVRVRVKNNTGDTRNMYVAAQTSGDSYKIVGVPLGFFPSSNNDVLYSPAISIARLCIKADSGVDCADLSPGSSVQTIISPLLYIFIGNKDDNFAPGFDISITDRAGGIYVQPFLSNQVPTGFVTLDRLLKGDSRVEAHYTGQTFNHFDEAFALISSLLPTTNNVGIEVASGGAKARMIEKSQVKGSIIVKELPNNVPVYVGVGLANKFGFGTIVSNYIQETPTAIEELLKSHSCFLLTAGFKRDHYVIDGFKWVRDNIISSFFGGKVFIKTYYKYSPKFAKVVYASEKLSKFVRTYATIFYYTIIGFGILLATGISFYLCKYLAYRRTRPKHQF